MYLLETSALLRATGIITEPVGKNAAAIIASNHVYISMVSLWEIAVLEKAGKLEVNLTPQAYLKQALKDLGGRVLHFKIAHINQYKNLPLLSYETGVLFRKVKTHTDPFDRMLIAQAIEEKCAILTKDEVFPLYSQVKTVW